MKDNESNDDLHFANGMSGSDDLTRIRVEMTATLNADA